MTDEQKIARLERALRTERGNLRALGGDDNIRGANAINPYLQLADTDSKLRFYGLLAQPGAAE